MKHEKLTSPSGLKFEIREQTGADDDLVSKASIDDAKLVNEYVANILVSGPDGTAYTSDQVKELRLRDKYFLVMSSRILSLGETLFFSYEWGGNIPSQEYEVDLKIYIWDYAEPFPVVGTPDWSDERFLPYDEKLQEFVLSTDKKVRFEFMTGVGEDFLLKLPPASMTANKELVARNLELEVNSEWKKVVNFGVFTAREMVEIRAKVGESDPQDQGIITISNPISGAVQQIPLLGIKDFFYPVKI